ncbi:MAG: hypothetical protein KDA96_13885 [Planctomycetaceae bacterium]|nr:hypothetical protein [Planctomycetaceae bacterium]
MASTNFSAEVGKQQFLQLFVTQLANQNPLEPTGQEEFLQQLAMFSQVEGTENLNTEVKSLNSKFDTLNDNVAALLQAQLNANTAGSGATGTDLSKLTGSASVLDDLKFASSLLGVSVTYSNQYGKLIQDEVTAVMQNAGQVKVVVGETPIALSEIQEIRISQS